MKRYFRSPAEPLPERGDPAKLGPGRFYVEFDGEWATRQGELFADGLRPASRDPGYFLCDQPLSRLTSAPPIEESTADEFEGAWRRSGAESG